MQDQTAVKNNLPYQKVLIGVIVIVVLAGLFLFFKSNSSTSHAKTFTLSEVSSHADATSCWLAIEGKVYDVTEFIPKHPGGKDILLGCGKDATAMFNSRPNDGTAHSDRAEVQLAEFEIGELSK